MKKEKQIYGLPKFVRERGREAKVLYYVLRLSKLVSLTFRQSYYPLVAVGVLFQVTFLQVLDLSIRLLVLSEVFLCTFALPYILGRLFDLANQRWGWIRLKRIRRQVHTLLSYTGTLLCIDLLQSMHMPFFVQGYLWVALAYQIVCMLVGLFWNISTQSAAAGSVVGALSAYSLCLGYDAVWWLCLTVLICGLVNTSCLILRRHTQWQIIAGTWVGLACGILVMVFL